MVVTVYVWLPNNENVGHASMMLSDGTYISWWPALVKSKTSVMKNMVSLQTSVEGAAAVSYEDDSQSEGQHANFMITIRDGVLDELAIKKWWSLFPSTNKYNIVSNNCCTAIFEALKQGGSQKYVPLHLSFVPTPANVKDYAEKLMYLGNVLSK